MSDLLKALLGLDVHGIDAMTPRMRQNNASLAIATLKRLTAAGIAALLFSIPFAQAATPADPIEVKLRYVVLLSTFIRGDTADLSACMLSEPLSNPSLESLASKLKYIDNTDDLSGCKSLFIPANYPIERDSLTEVTNNPSVLVLSDNDEICDLADVFLFQNGKRIFFHIDLKALKEKTFSLAAQVLALSKKHKCEKGKK